MKVKLIEPGHRYPVGTQMIGMPLGLLYLIAYLREAIKDISVEMVSLRMKEVLREEVDVEHVIGDADIVAATSITSNFDTAVEVLNVAKRKGCITVIGGIFPTYNSGWIMRNYPMVDFLIRGDGEISFSNLVQCIIDRKKPVNVKGLSWRDDGKIVHNQDDEMLNLDCVPTPAFDILDIEQYKSLAPASIYSIRGCAWSCKFCSLSPFRKNHALYLRVDEVIKELELFRQFGFTRVRIEDETATLNRARSLEMYKRIAEKNLGLQFNIKTRVDAVDRELLKVLWDAGVRQIKYGLEVPDETSLRDMRKGAHLTELEQALEITLELGFRVAGVFVLGWPGVVPDDIKEHAKFINKWGNMQNFITMFTFITPHPGTPLWEDASSMGLRILTNNLSRYTHKQPVAVPDSFGPNGLRLLVDTYHELAVSTNSVHYNPPVDMEYLAELGYPISQTHDSNFQFDESKGDCCV